MRDGLILVQGAMDVETEWLTAQLEAPEETELGEFPFWRGTCRGRELVVSRTGVGMVRAAAATALGIQRFAPALVVNQGIAGAHREDLHVGDIVVGRTCVPIHQVQMPPRSRGEGTAPGDWALWDFAREAPPAPWAADPDWAARFEGAPHAGGRKVSGRLGSGDVFHQEQDRIAWLRERAGEDCEDMESGAAFQVCQSLGTPCLGLRIISNNELTGEPYRREVGEGLQRFVLEVLTGHP